MSDCPLCDRRLANWGGLQKHLQSKHPGLYCGRCQRDFPSKVAKRQHIDDSPAHHICRICSHKPDFLSVEELDEHVEAKHNYCTPCERSFNTRDQLVQHDIDEHNLCETCGKYFGSASNLTNHLKTHAKKTTECPGCPKIFISSSAWVLHLETGCCKSGVDVDWINNIAFECYQAERYTCEDDPEFDFECSTCDSRFQQMSALLQHAESEACDEDLAGGKPLGKFLHYLRTRL